MMQTVVEEDGEVHYWEDFLPEVSATDLLVKLRTELTWESERYRMYGKWVTAPRLVCWHGDAGASYRYSGIAHIPKPWTPSLMEIRARIESALHRSFNSVLGNLYRNGQDSMGWHADKEQELGVEPYIASLSLGATRSFNLRHNRSKRIVVIPLTSGSLLTMGGALQHYWQHSVPKVTAEAGERINLTFRTIY